MADADIHALLPVFKALGNESRLRILGLIAGREHSVQELAALTALKEPTVSHHLAALKGAGLVSVRVDGVTHWHKLERDALTALSRALFDHKTVAALGAPQTEDERIVGNYLQADGALSQLPATRRKRWVVLKFLMSAFDERRRYREGEVNEIIQRRHWDSATIRREMIGYKMLARENGVYWKLPEAGWAAA